MLIRKNIARHPHDDIFDFNDFDTLHLDEWDEKSIGRIDVKSWKDRYKYEASLITEVLNNNIEIDSILELGSGPGLLSQEVLAANDKLVYHMVDKEYAKKYFDENNFKGEMFVKDLSAGFDTSGLLSSYDLIITNDFLEHVLNPSAIAQGIYNLTHENSKWMVSNPNWRMGHQYVYRGLFDHDNLVYFLHTHGFTLESMWGSPLTTPYAPKLQSEQGLPDNLIQSWNHYLLCGKRELMSDEDKTKLHDASKAAK